MIKFGLATLALLAVGSVSTARAAPAWDPKYAVCLQTFEGISYTTTECLYNNMDQCQMAASGRSAGCVVNPYYQGAAQAAPGRRHKKRQVVE